MAQTLFTNESGTVGALTASGSFLKADTAILTVFVWGTFDGARVRLQTSPDAGTTWFDDRTKEMEFTFRDARNFNVAPGVQLRAVLDQAGTSTSLSMIVY